MTWKEYREVRKKWFGENRIDSKKSYHRYKLMLNRKSLLPFNPTPTIKLDTIWVDEFYTFPPVVSKETKEGNNPMSVTTETEHTRTYLTRRLRAINDDKYYAIRKLFGVDVNPAPSNYKELIDWIKTGKYELDKKRVKILEAMAEDSDEDDDIGYCCCGPFDGINWTARKRYDEEYNAAVKENTKRYQDVLDTINVSGGEAALSALKSFEDWMPKAPK